MLARFIFSLCAVLKLQLLNAKLLFHRVSLLFGLSIGLLCLGVGLLWLNLGTHAYAESTTAPSSPQQTIPQLTINGAIGPATSLYLLKEIELANQQQVPLIVITLDTPGGLVSSLRDINQAILNSNVPVACLVYPQGARAASAGTYMLYACHVAAMASTTTLGAATPVNIGNPLPGGEKPPQRQPAEEQPNKEPLPSADDASPDADGEPRPQPDSKSAMQKKVLNDAIAYIRSLAQLRKRNAQWAELAVKEAATLTASEALAKNVINMIADSPQQLVDQLNGQYVNINQQDRLLQLTNASLQQRQPDWRHSFISTITNPNIAYILMLIGIYGILLEFYSPGVGIAGVSGAISLLIALYAFQLLPLDYVGLGLLLLGIALLVTESMVPSFGIFGLGGIIAFTLGSIFLFDTELPQFQVSLQLIAAVAVTSLLFFIFVFGYLWKMRKNQAVSGREALQGVTVIITDAFIGDGYVELNGERWAAHSPEQLHCGQTVIVSDIDGLRLILSPTVSPAEANNASNH